MVNTTLIVSGIIINVICIWMLYFILQEKRKFKYVKYLCGGLIGAIIAIIFYPLDFMTIALFSCYGAIIGEVLLVLCLIIKNMCEKEQTFFYDDCTERKFFITGDKHRNFKKVKKFCKQVQTRKKDVLIVLGDSGFNYYEDERDDKLKKEMSALNITLFCLYGNKEKRAENIATYGVCNFCGGKVMYEPKYRNILFAIDGEIYTFAGKKYMVIGGAHSVDKLKRIEEGEPYWEDEMPGEAIKQKIEERLDAEDNNIFGMLTHTCPIDYLPSEVFVSTRQNAIIKRKPRKAKSKKMFKPDIDRSTEEWLGKLEKKLNYNIWFCGHYHIDKQIDKINMMCNEILPLQIQMSENDDA